MKRWISLGLAVLLFFSGLGFAQRTVLATPYATDVLLQEVFTFTDREGNVSEPQVLCRWEYDEMGRLSRVVDETKRITTPGYAYCMPFSFGVSPRQEQDPLRLGTERTYTYDGIGKLSLITYTREEYGITYQNQGVPTQDEMGNILSQSIVGLDGECTVSYFYNEKNLLTGILAKKMDDDGEHYTEYSYEYDNDGLLVAESGICYGTYYYYMPNVWSPYDYEGDSWERTYTYDDWGRLVSGTYTKYQWNADMMNYWIGYETTDQYKFVYEGDRLVQVLVTCGDELLYRDKSVYKEAFYTAYTVDLIYGNCDPVVQALRDDPDNGLQIYTDLNNFSVQLGGSITIGAGVLKDGALTQGAEGILFQVEDDAVLKLVEGGIESDISYIRLEGMTEGITYVTVADSATGERVTLPVTVYDHGMHSYTLSSVPSMDYVNYPVNIYNANGLYVDRFAYTVREDGWATVSFDVYNTNYIYGTVEVFYEDGTCYSTQLINKLTTNRGSIKEVYVDSVGSMIRDVACDHYNTYRQELGVSKKTEVAVEIPPNGYLRVGADPKNSVPVHLLNYFDMLFAASAFSGGLDTETEDYAAVDSTWYITLMDNLSEALQRTPENMLNLFDDSNSMANKLWNSAGANALVYDLTSIQAYLDKAKEAFYSGELFTVLGKAGISLGGEALEDAATSMMGPAKLGFSVVFGISKIEGLVRQVTDFMGCAGNGVIYIANQGGGVRSCQKIRVTCEAGFSENTAVRVTAVTLDDETVEKIQRSDEALYEALTEGIAYTYNISLLESGKIIQPKGETKVYIPVPDDLKRLANRNKTAIYRTEEDGSFTEMPSWIENGCFVFVTDHFSLYTVVGYDAPDEEKQEEPDPVVWPWVAAAVCAAAAAGVCAVFVIKKKRK